MARFLYGTLILATLFLSGCAGLKANKPTPPCSALPWSHVPPASFDPDHYAALMEEVQPAQRAEAINALKAHLFIPVSPEKAAQLTGTEADSWIPGATFLLRGLRYPKGGDGRFAVIYDENGGLVVLYDRVGDTESKPYAAPVVVVLPQRPAAIYVTCLIEH